MFRAESTRLHSGLHSQVSPYVAGVCSSLKDSRSSEVCTVLTYILLLILAHTPVIFTISNFYFLHIYSSSKETNVLMFPFIFLFTSVSSSC